MRKVAERRIEPGKRILGTEDRDTLAAEEVAWLGAVPMTFSRKRVEEMQAQMDRPAKGLDRGYTWAEVKKRALRKGRR